MFAGDWKQHEVWDGTYTLKDLLDWYEMTWVKKENERRFKEYVQGMQGALGNGS